MSNSAQLLVHNIRAMQSLSIQARRDGQRQDFRRGTDGSASDITHTCTRAHTACSSCHGQTQPSTATKHRWMLKVQWRATVSTWELVKQHNPNKTKKKGGNCWGGGIYPFRHNHPISDPRECTQISGGCGIPGMWCWPTCPILAMVLKPHHQKCEDLDYFHWDKGN